MATDYKAAAAKMQALVDTWEAKARKGTLTARQQGKLATDLRTLNVDLAEAAVALPAALTVGKPVPAPSGLTIGAAAEIDAGFVFDDAIGLGSAAADETNPAPGAAKAFGYGGVVGSGDVYGVFVNGELVSTGPNPAAAPGSHFSMKFGVASGFDPDAPYTGPGAVRP